jgi:competence protein ComEC
MDGEGSQYRLDERILFVPRDPSASPSAAAAGAMLLGGGSAPAGTHEAEAAGSRPGLYRLHALRHEWRRSVSLEIDRGAAFLMMPVLLGLGAVAYFTAAFEPGWFQLGAALAILAGSTCAGRNRPAVRAVFLSMLVIVAGACAAKLETWRAGTKIVGGEITTRVTGRVETIERRENGRVRLTLAVMATQGPTLRYQPDRVRLTARAVPASVVPGSVVSGLARLQPPLGPLRPRSYDFAFESYFDGIGANGFFLRNPVVADLSGSPTVAVSMLAWLERQRMALADRIRGHIGGAEGEIAAALVAGTRAGIPEPVNEALRKTGLAHVLSISGLHMALVAGVVIGSLRLAFAAFPGFASRHPVRKYAALFALVALGAYLLISGSQVAAERSFLMIAVMLVALIFDRAALTMRNLAIAAIAILLVAPHEAVGPSFQMSFAATAALIAAYGWWSQMRARRAPTGMAGRGAATRIARTVVLYALGLAATSLIAGTATGIFGAWHFQRVSPLGLAANLAAMPIFSILVMPAAVAGVVLMPLGLDGLAFAAMGKGLAWALAIAAWLAERTPLDAIGAFPFGALILLSIALVPLTLATTRAVRMLAVPLLLAGSAAIALRDLPAGFVSEDARLVGVLTPAGTIAVSGERPNRFVVEDWTRALMASRLVKPAMRDGLADGSPDGIATDRFLCADGLCTIRLASGAILAHAATAGAAARACAAALIVIADATAANPCPGSTARIVRARHLALNGSAEIRPEHAGAVAIVSAIDGSMRPWHDHRRFSRAARGMAPYVPAARAKPAAAERRSAGRRVNTSGSVPPAVPGP